jgi:putative ABC transport system substrate-binding protein
MGNNLTDARRREFVDLVSARGSTPVAELRFFEIRTVDDYEPAFDRVARDKMGGVAITFTPLSSVNQDLIAALITRHRLPAIADGRGYAEAGVLLTYSTDFPALMKRSAGFVAKILNGAKPADIPVEQASRFVLIVNLKTAKNLGIRVPRSILAAAQSIIE